MNNIPKNVKYYTFSCIHCGNHHLSKACDDEYWCYKCNDYVMIEYGDEHDK
jgi:PHP family Zn ribbon phosphoesterase